LAGGALRAWRATPSERTAAVRAALALLRGAWAARWQDAAAADDLQIVDLLLARVAEVADPEPSVALPGQQTETRWGTPRGVGLVALDDGAPVVSLLALVLGAVLAGNGVVVVVQAARRPAAAALVEALHECGIPWSALCLAPVGLDIAAAVQHPELTFAAADLGIEAARDLYRMLGEASAAPEASTLKALITLTDGPNPTQPGFLRRFALPKTVAVQTLHLGADLELLTNAGE